MTARFSWKVTLPLALATLLAACGGSGGSSSGGSDNSAPRCTGSVAWCAPVGATVKGVTLDDGWEDLRLVPAPVNVSGGWTDSVAITPDGEEMLFAYSTFDFPTLNVGLHKTPPEVDQVVTGQRRTGQTTDDFQIFQADLSNSGWSVTHHPAGDNSKSEASASYNEDRDLMVFSRFDGSGNATLYYSSFDGSTWSTAADVETLPGAPNINSGCQNGDDNGFIIGANGASVTLYWESHRGAADGSTCGGDRHIYQTTFDGTSTWSPIELVPGLADTVNGSDDSQVSFSPDGLTAYWTSVRLVSSVPTYTLFTADWDGTNSTYTNVRPLLAHTTAAPYAGKLVFQGEINVASTPEGLVAYFMCAIAQSNDPNNAALRVCRMKKPVP